MIPKKPAPDLVRATESIQNARNRFAPADRFDRRSHRHSGEIPGAFDYRLFQQNRLL